MLENRDYTLIIDKSGSMATPDQKGGRSRWVAAQESTLALASKCEQFDLDGITIYVFSGKFKRYENVTSSKVAQIFQENDPSGTTDLAGVLKHATDDYFQRKAGGKTKPNGETILVVTDGEASRRMDRDEELAISFIQVGTDQQATRFLKVLDDDLQGAGAKFDICDTITMEDMEDLSLSEVLLNAVND
jgi:uncharacterized protein with von Willebrand factor type A (vWA) domain